jgi:acyl-homoserine lactone acylase PvdQ
VDLYLETIRATGGGSEVLFNNTWVPLRTSTEIIKVVGADPVSLQVDVTPHGPVLNAAIPVLNAIGPIAVRSTLALGQYRVDGFFDAQDSTNFIHFKCRQRL